MKRRFKSKQIFLVIVISLFVVALPVYLRCTNLSGAKFVSSDIFFENPDQESGPSDTDGNGLKVFGATAFSITFLPGTHLRELLSHLFPQAPSSRQETFVLRC